MKNDLLVCHHFFEDPLKIPFKTHAHDKWEFLFIVKGNPICMIEGRRYAVQEGTLLVFKPAQIHRVHASGGHPYEYFSLMCDEAILSLQSIRRFSVSAGILTFKKPKRIHRMFSEINAQCQNISLDSSARVKLLTIEALMKSVEEELKNDSPVLLSEDAVVVAAVSFIESNLHRITRLNQICDAVGVRKERLYDRFIHNMLISPMKYVRAKRTALAKADSSTVENRVAVLKKYGFKNEKLFDEEYMSFYRSVP